MLHNMTQKQKLEGVYFRMTNILLETNSENDSISNIINKKNKT
jgi:hypothetical protein